MNINVREYLRDQLNTSITFIEDDKTKVLRDAKPVPAEELKYQKMCMNLQRYAKGNGREVSLDHLRSIITWHRDTIKSLFGNIPPTSVLNMLNQERESLGKHVVEAAKMKINCPQAEAQYGERCKAIIMNSFLQGRIDQLNAAQELVNLINEHDDKISKMAKVNR